MSAVVTDGAGFIGSNFALDWLAQCDEPVVNLDALTYAGNLENLVSLQGDGRHVFVKGDIGDAALVASLLAEHQPRAIINFAAESRGLVLAKGWPGETFNIGGHNERTSLQVVEAAHERCILWNDATLQIEWPAGIQPILSAKDIQSKPFDQAEVFA